MKFSKPDNRSKSVCRKQFTLSAGFTLLELMIGIAIVAIVASISAGGMLGWLDQRGLRTAVEQLRGDMQRAKLLAIKQQTNCTLTINAPVANKYTISLSGQVVDLGKFRGNVSFNGGSTAVITFNPWGTCNAGDIRLASVANPTLYRLRTSGAGGISKQIWSGTHWVSANL